MKRIFRTLAVLAILPVLIISQLGQLNAQSNALIITPRKDYTLEPGESVSDTLRITNRDPQNPLNLKLTVADFTSEDETGTPLLLESNTPKTAWSLRDYITLPDQVIVEPGQEARVPITLDIPADLGAGSYYSAIEYAAVNDIAEDKVNISASSITLMFVKIPGQAKQQLNFEQFGAFKPNNTGNGGSFAGLFFSDKPTVMAYRLENQGNIAEQPTATIIIKDFRGEEIYTIEDANPRDQLALRGQTRRFDTCIVTETIEQNTQTGGEFNAVVCGDTDFKPGRYTAELSVVYGENGNETREITAHTTFWYLPWWFVGVISLALALVAGFILYVIKRIKNYRGRKTRRR